MPSTVLENVTLADAEALQAKLAAAGATTRISISHMCESDLANQRVERVGQQEGISPRGDGVTTYSLILESAGSQGANVGIVKILREAKGLGLAEAYALVKNMPSTVLENVTLANAEALQAKLAAAGATTRISIS